MKNIQPLIKKFMAHYASEFDAIEIQKILAKESIDSKDEAKSIIDFLNRMCPKVAEDAKKNVRVLNQVVHTTDAEKVCNEMEDYIEEIGYGDLLGGG